MARRTLVFGPAYLDRVVHVDRPLVDPALGPPLDQSVDGRWEFGEGLTLIDPIGSGSSSSCPAAGRGRRAWSACRARCREAPRAWRRVVRGLSWHDDLGGMGAGFAAALGGELVSALGPEDDPTSRVVADLLARAGIAHRPVRVPDQPADWTLLVTSGGFGDKLPIGFRGCHAALGVGRPRGDLAVRPPGGRVAAEPPGRRGVARARRGRPVLRAGDAEHARPRPAPVGLRRGDRRPQLQPARVGEPGRPRGGRLAGLDPRDHRRPGGEHRPVHDAGRASRAGSRSRRSPGPTRRVTPTGRARPTRRPCWRRCSTPAGRPGVADEDAGRAWPPRAPRPPRRWCSTASTSASPPRKKSTRPSAPAGSVRDAFPQKELRRETSLESSRGGPSAIRRVFQDTSGRRPDETPGAKRLGSWASRMTFRSSAARPGHLSLETLPRAGGRRLEAHSRPSLRLQRRDVLRRSDLRPGGGRSLTPSTKRVGCPPPAWSRSHASTQRRQGTTTRSNAIRREPS